MSDITGHYNYYNSRYQYYCNPSGTIVSDHISGLLPAYTISASSNSSYVGSVEKLNLSQVTDLFTHGNLGKEEIECWFQAHSTEVEVLSPVKEENGMLKCAFNFRGQKYELACSKETTAPQLDSNTAETYTLKDLHFLYKLDDSVIEKYFVLSAVSTRDIRYTLNPNCEYKNIAELRKAHKEITQKFKSRNNIPQSNMNRAKAKIVGVNGNGEKVEIPDKLKKSY